MLDLALLRRLRVLLLVLVLGVLLLVVLLLVALLGRLRVLLVLLTGGVRVLPVALLRPVLGLLGMLLRVPLVVHVAEERVLGVPRFGAGTPAIVSHRHPSVGLPARTHCGDPGARSSATAARASALGPVGTRSASGPPTL
ncbi:hypothetical protein [Actinacidiphila reveromycinica]|uniref:hypothetical protein n=1 Tax=Actinacidiphila reveromycinica TaxID=659352 RepID=UPI003D2C330B